MEVAEEALDMTDWGLMTEMSSFTNSKELVELVMVELTGPGGLGAESFFFFFLTGGGGGGLLTRLTEPFIVLGLAPVLGAATGVDISSEQSQAGT